jgi:hypothetical protein
MSPPPNLASQSDRPVYDVAKRHPCFFTPMRAGAKIANNAHPATTGYVVDTSAKPKL